MKTKENASRNTSEAPRTPQEVVDAVHVIAGYLRAGGYKRCVVAPSGGASFLQTESDRALIEEYEQLRSRLVKELAAETRKRKGFFRRLAESSEGKRTIFFFRGMAYSVEARSEGCIPSNRKIGWKE